MDIIKPENLLNELLNLKSGEHLILVFPTDVVKKLRLSKLQRESMENLFTSYLNNTCEEANKFNLDNFLQKYGATYAGELELIRETLVRMVGNEVYVNMVDETKYRYSIDFVTERVIIARI